MDANFNARYKTSLFIIPAELYQQMNGMSLREMDQIVYPVCKLCRDHERSGFVEGIKVGMRMAQKLAAE